MGLKSKIQSIFSRNEKVSELNNMSLLDDYRNFEREYRNNEYESAWEYLKMFRAELMNAYGLANYCEREQIPCYINTMDLTDVLVKVDRMLNDENHYPVDIDRDTLCVLSQRTIEAARRVFTPGVDVIHAEFETYIASFPGHQEYMEKIPLTVYIPCHLPEETYGIDRTEEPQIRTSDILTPENGYRHLQGNVYKKEGQQGLVVNMDPDPVKPADFYPDMDM